MGKWQNLTAKQKAQVIRFAIQNGVSDINSIRDTYNLYSNGDNLTHKKSGKEQGESQDLNYPNGVIRQGKQDILKKIVQSPVGAFTRFLDPTGILSIPDAYYDLKHLAETPTTQRTTADYVDAMASIVGLFPLGNNISDFVKVKNWRQGLQLANKYAEHLPFKLVGVYPDMYQYHNQKSTGGPLYPFSFEKNLYLKTPVVRYDEGGLIRDWDSTLTGKLINYVENSDSIGWVPQDRTWEHPTLPGYDKNQIGMGVDKNKTKGYAEHIKQRRNGTPYLTEKDERVLRHAAIEKANTSANARYKFAQQAVNRPEGTISKVKDAAVVSAIYNLGATYVANGLFEDKDFMLKLFDGTDQEVVDRINQEYKKKKRNERIAKTNQFLFKK